MIARSFKSVAWVAAIGAAALICYMFSLRGAAERAELVQLNSEVVRLHQSIRTLQTELGTRGRIDQLQHWASTDFGFSAPVANQFVDNEVSLARLDQPAEPAPMAAPVQMASGNSAAPAPRAAPAPAPAPIMPRVIQASAPKPAARPTTPRSQPAPQPILHRAALVETRQRPAAPAAKPRTTPAAPAIRPAAAAVPARPAPRAAAALARPAPRAAAAAAPARTAARPTALVSERTLRDLSGRERAERRAAGTK